MLQCPHRKALAKVLGQTANSELVPYEDIYSKIKETLLLSRNQAYSAVNFAMVQAYWQIGRIIVEHEQNGNARADYGKAVLQELSSRLTKDFGIIRIINIKLMDFLYSCNRCGRDYKPTLILRSSQSNNNLTRLHFNT